MERRDFLKFTTLAAAMSAYPSVALASGDNFTLNDVRDVAKSAVDEIFKSNDFYARAKGPEFFEGIKKGQHPRVTVVGCSDSRFQTGALDKTPENDLFVIRNIGNQYTSNEGSVEYGVHHLHTPLLLITGHTRCGAIKAAMSDYSEESSAIRKEVDTLALSIKKAKFSGSEDQKWVQGVVQNVKMQVMFATKRFEAEVKSGKLTVLGVVYDLANDLNEGYGKLKIVSVNNETDPEKIRSNNIVKAVLKK